MSDVSDLNQHIYRSVCRLEALFSLVMHICNIGFIHTYVFKVFSSIFSFAAFVGEEFSKIKALYCIRCHVWAYF